MMNRCKTASETVKDSFLFLSWKGQNVSWTQNYVAWDVWCNICYINVYDMNVMNMHVCWWAVLMKIDESWTAEDKRILTAVGENNSLAAAGEGKNLWLLQMRSPGTTVGGSGVWVVCQSTGDFCLEEIFTGEYSNILWGAENESLHSAWGFWNLTLRGVSFCKALWLGIARIIWVWEGTGVGFPDDESV